MMSLYSWEDWGLGGSRIYPELIAGQPHLLLQECTLLWSLGIPFPQSNPGYFNQMRDQVRTALSHTEGFHFDPFSCQLTWSAGPVEGYSHRCASVASSVKYFPPRVVARTTLDDRCRIKLSGLACIKCLVMGAVSSSYLGGCRGSMGAGGKK